MARKTFLTSDQLKDSGSRFLSWQLGGADSLGYQFSAWLGERALELAAEIPGWREARPVLLGSWARGELCPQSDLDLLFLGPDEIVSQVTSHFQKQGIKLRSRIPVDKENWCEGVEFKDWLSLRSAQAVFPEEEALVLSQKNKVNLFIKKHKRRILSWLKDRKSVV